MALFDVPKRSNRQTDKSIAAKSKSKSSSVVRGGGLLARLNEIRAMVEKNLGEYKDKYIVINDKDVLIDYIGYCLQNKYISIDTETTGLDPLQDKLVGICINTREMKPAYIPINHISYITGVLSKGQLPIDFVIEQFRRIKDIDVDMFNSAFDIRVLRHAGWEDAYCTWDGYLAMRLMNENEPTNALKPLHNKYCMQGKKDVFTFDDLFKGITFDKIPIDIAYLYAAHDPDITTELCDYQRQYLYYESDKPKEDRNGMNGVAWVFQNIEMPCVNSVTVMEDNGIALDVDYADKLHDKYSKKLEELSRQFDIECSKVTDEKISITSPVQIAHLLYDIMKIASVDKKSPRGTGEEILEKIGLPITKIILEHRGVNKLLSTYIDKLPNCVNPNDGRVHGKFNQYGAKTGRFSSSDPNLQNIPSHNKDIRPMFVASEGYVLMSSDFSQQEPKCLAAMCKQAGDSQMYETFMAGKDLYSEIASKAFNKSYEECLEFNSDGTTNEAGAERRTQAKSILLGVLYGRGEKSVAEQLNVSEEKAHNIKQSVFDGFPAIKQFEDASFDMAYEKGYVTTVCGRKRRLPDLQLNEFEFRWKDGAPPDDDLLDFDVMPKPEYNDTEVPQARIDYYTRKLHKVWGSQKKDVFAEARDEGIIITDNGAKIADAERQIVNSRIQGSAADLTKLAMIRLQQNAKANKLGLRLLIQVHDEIIAECPEENAKECSKLLADIMSQSAEEVLEMPVKCDVVLSRCWYGERIEL